jgi:hypothetical protein
MAIRKRQESREQKRYTRRATKKRGAGVSVRPWKIVTVMLCGIAGIVLALVLGNYLGARSDALREEGSRNDWMLDTSTPTLAPTEVPDIRAVAIKPEGNVGDILIAGKHGGVILPLCGETGIPRYASAVGKAAGLSIDPNAPSLADDIARVSRRGLNVTAVYALTCFTTPDTATAAYRRGLDLALLRECAEASPDDILLLGLPCGSDDADRRALTFLQEWNALLADLPPRPAIGAALPPSAFAENSHASEEETQPLYAGSLSPARLRTACDYLAMDLRSMSAVGVGTLLPDIQFAYMRHSLRLLVNIHDREAVEAPLSHGFERVFEMEPPPAASESGDETLTE